MKTFFIYTIGCQANEYDSERLAQALRDAGWARAGQAELADLLLVNTCTVRQLAEQKAFSHLGRWLKWKIERPELVIGMVGCLAQHMEQEAFRRAPGLDFIAGPRALTRIPELAASARAHRHQEAYEDSGYGGGVLSADAPGGITATVAVMEGCEQCCSYCAVPKARGRETSRPVSAILTEVQHRLAAGAKEIVLLGQNVNRYGRDLSGELDFAGLLGQVAALPGLVRLRFMTSHPKGFSPRLIDALAGLPVLTEALHLPLQSGSTRILKAMNRGYTAEEYLELVRQLRRAVPKMMFSTDVIVGFPGETEEDFTATLDLLREIGINLAYCFKYSPRKDTAAAGMPGQVPQEVKEERLERLLALIRQLAFEAHARLVNTTQTVLVENAYGQSAPVILKGRSRNNCWVSFAGPQAWVGSERTVHITAAEAFSLSGEVHADPGGAGSGPI